MTALPHRREALDAKALEEDTVRAETEAALVGDEKESRRMSLMGVGPLLGQRHFLPSVEAKKKKNQVWWNPKCAGEQTTNRAIVGRVTHHAWVLRL